MNKNDFDYRESIRAGEQLTGIRLDDLTEKTSQQYLLMLGRISRVRGLFESMLSSIEELHDAAGDIRKSTDRAAKAVDQVGEESIRRVADKTVKLLVAPAVNKMMGVLTAQAQTIKKQEDIIAAAVAAVQEKDRQIEAVSKQLDRYEAIIAEFLENQDKGIINKIRRIFK